MTPRWRAATAITLVAWCALVLALRRPAQITDDWQGWRQADTQAIARNLAFEELAPLHPRIDWRGDGPGYVETEAQLYPTLIALVMRVTGEATWPGQLLSLACTVLALTVVTRALARRFGDRPAYLALLAMLGHQGTIAIATSIQPDALALLAFTLGLTGFLAYLEAPSRRALALWVVATTIAGLVKPTTLELGLVQVLLAATARPRLAALRDVRLWLGWACVLAIVGAFLWHAHQLYVTYGNTFGMLAGGDSKLPTRAMALQLPTWFGLARYEVMWGTGALAVPAAGYLAWRRKLGAPVLALAAAALALDVLALRYTSGPFGTHYHLPHVVLGGWLVAAAMAELLPRLGTTTTRIALVSLAVIPLALGARAVRFLRALPPEPETELAARLADLAPPGTLIAVRARAPGFDPEWQTTNNFEDPRVFYGSRTHGWVLPNDLAGAGRLAELAARGARYYVHVRQKPIDAELAAWLAAHATLAVHADAGEIYRLGDASRTK